MSVQFLDMRIALDSPQDLPGLELTSSSPAYKFGDIGLLTAHVSPGNAGLVRITLNAYTRLQLTFTPAPTIIPAATFFIYRNGTLIFSTTYQKAAGQTDISYEFASITAVDFPPAADVLNGLIQYTIYVSTNYGITLGARSFSGMAVAGNG